MIENDQISKYSKIRALKALINKEFLQIFRDPSSILIAFILPLILLFLFSYAVSLDINKINLALLIEDESPMATSFASSIFNSRYFNASICENRKICFEKINEGKIKGFLVIPEYFTKRIKRSGTQVPIQVITDGSEPNTANFLQNYLQATLLNWMQQSKLETRGSPSPAQVELLPRFWFNEELVSRNFLIPGSIAIIMTLIGTLLTALVVAREWERGTMEALMSTPVGIFELVVGKLVPYYFLGIGSMLLCVIVATTILKIPFRGSILVLALITSAFLLAALTLGLLISTTTRNQFLASQLALLSGYLPAFLLSGFIFEISSMPLPIRILTHILPARYFVACLQTIFLAGDLLEVLIPNVLGILAIASFLLIVTTKNTKKRLD